MKDSNNSGGTRAVLIIGFIASLITICTFMTGIVSFPQIFGWLSSQNSGNDNTPTYQGMSESTSVIEDAPTVYPVNKSNWTSIGLQGETVSIIATGSGNNIYAGTNKNEHGIFKTLDNGDSWSAKNNGLGELDIYDLVIAPANPNKIIAITDNYIWISSDGGNSWTSESPGRSNSQDYAVSMGGTDGNLLYAVDKYIDTYISIDGGKSWNGIANWGYCDHMYTVLSTGRIYCLYNYWSPDSIYWSDDKGKKWWKAASVGAQYDLTTIAIDESSDLTIYAGTERYGIYKSTDGGGSWNPINNTLPNQGHDLYITSIVVDPLASDMVYIEILDHGVYKSTNAGESWEVLTNGLSSEVTGKLLSLGISIDSPRYLFAGTDGLGILRYQLP